MRRTVLFFLTVLAVAAGLMVFNWIPRAVGGRGTVAHVSFESLPRSLAVSGVYRPSYFPERLRWPPAEILTHAEGASMLMHFNNRQDDRVELSVAQAVGPADLIPSRIEPFHVISQRDIPFRGQQAHLTIATCRDGSPCNRISWQDGATTLALSFRGPEQDLLRIAQSVIPEKIR